MIKVYVDAAYAKHLAAGACVIYYNGTQQYITFEIEHATNNHDAEFYAMIETLNYCIQHYDTKHTFVFYSDSQVVVKAMERLSAKNDWQQQFVEKLKIALQLFDQYFVQWYSDKANGMPNQLAQQKLLQLKTKNRK